MSTEQKNLLPSRTITEMRLYQGNETICVFSASQLGAYYYLDGDNAGTIIVSSDPKKLTQLISALDAILKEEEE